MTIVREERVPVPVHQADIHLGAPIAYCLPIGATTEVGTSPPKSFSVNVNAACNSQCQCNAYAPLGPGKYPTGTQAVLPQSTPSSGVSANSGSSGSSDSTSSTDDCQSFGNCGDPGVNQGPGTCTNPDTGELVDCT